MRVETYCHKFEKCTTLKKGSFEELLKMIKQIIDGFDRLGYVDLITSFNIKYLRLSVTVFFERNIGCGIRRCTITYAIYPEGDSFALVIISPMVCEERVVKDDKDNTLEYHL